MDESKIVLGKRYRDIVTGFEGTATARYEFIHGCTRIQLETLQNGEVKQWAFDAPSLAEIDADGNVVETITSTRKGGDRPGPAARGPVR